MIFPLSEEGPAYDGLSIYPNPATTSILVNLPEGLYREIEIWSLNGKLHRKLKVANEQEMVVQIGDLTKGVYLLNLVSDKQVYRRKFIKL